MQLRVKRQNVLVICLVGYLTACSPIHQWPVAKSSDGPYIDSGREFSVDLPAEIVLVSSNGSGQVRSVDFIVTRGLASQDWYSVEWTTLKTDKKQSDGEFYDSWEKFLPKYLSKNFGNGHYMLRMKERATFDENYPCLRFVGEGVNNGGGSGFIFGTAIGFGDRVAVLYMIRSGRLGGASGLQSLPGYPAYDRFVRSLTIISHKSGR